MTVESKALRRVLILADESADWKIGGLRQLDRLALALNEFAESKKLETKIDIIIFWKPEIPIERRWLPKDSRLGRYEVADHTGVLWRDGISFEYVLSTHLLLARRALAEFVTKPSLVRYDAAIVAESELWPRLFQDFENAYRSAHESHANDRWRYVARPSTIPERERWLLRHTGKSQDGFVSRFLNRPLSRSISRILLKLPVTPAAWTLSIFVLPIAGFLFLLRGNYAGFVGGTVIFQLYSILDGCDGEIARAKYLESDSGRRFDTLCDILGSIVLTIGLGWGLYHKNRFGSHAWLYLAEGVLCVLFIAANEWFLRGPKTESGLAPGALMQTLYPRHRELILHSGLSFLDEKFVWWLFQLTKRDVAIFVFLLLAIAGRPQWILHLWIAVTAASLALTLAAPAARSR